MTSLSMVTTPASALFCSAVIADSMIGDLPPWGKSRGIDGRTSREWASAKAPQNPACLTA
jgi:hypothetical protein